MNTAPSMISSNWNAGRVNFREYTPPGAQRFITQRDMNNVDLLADMASSRHILAIHFGLPRATHIRHSAAISVEPVSSALITIPLLASLFLRFNHWIRVLLTWPARRR